MPSFAGGLSIDKELVVQLAKHPNIIGMKDSSGNVANLKELVGATTEYDFAMLAGTGSVFYECLTHGATGGIVRTGSTMRLGLFGTRLTDRAWARHYVIRWRKQT